MVEYSDFNELRLYMKLKFNENGKFKILLFGDLHENYDYAESPKFRDMQKLMNASLDRYSPDLCVLLGDVCSTHGCDEEPEKFKAMATAVCKPMFDRNIPVTVIFGNHEHDPGCDDAVVKAYNEIGCIMRNESDGPHGKADYKELIYSSDGKTPKFCLWFIDSNNLYPDQAVSDYDIVYPDQIEWFERESAKLREQNGGNPMPSFVFQHIPVPEEYRLLRKARIWELPFAAKGFNTKSGNRYMLKKGCEGYLGEGPCSPDIDDGQFDSWKKVGGVLGAFFGHDHLNDFSGYVDGIYLAQHKTAGFRAYTDGCRSCVRLLTLDENDLGSFEQELRHFKEFGLECECLGPIFKRISDRQSTNMHIAAKILGAAAGTAALAVGAKYIIKAKLGKKGEK